MTTTTDTLSPAATSRRLAREAGQSLPLIAVMFVVLCGFVGLTIDVGNGLLQKRRLQAAVDLGLLSGARDLPSTTTASTTAATFVRSNFSRATDQPVTVTASTACMTTGCASPNKLSVTAKTTTPTYFVRLFGKKSWNVGAKGAACAPCATGTASYDVVVVLDRSNSMSDGDMANAKEGIRELLGFFDPTKDRIALTVLESSDAIAPTFRSGLVAPCDSGGTSYSSTSYLASAYTGYGGSAGAFMDGTAASHDSWLVVPLSQGTTFKNANGTLNENSTYLNTLDCIENKGSTPIGPAMQAATNELSTNGRATAKKVIIYFGDGGASSMPLLRQCRQRTSTSSSWQSWRACVTGDGASNLNQSSGPLRQWQVTGSASWYTWATGDRDRPCQDAIDQSRRASSQGFDVYTIGYGVNSDWCRPGMSSSPPEVPNITQLNTIKTMASSTDKFHQQAARGDVQAIFATIGREITAGGTRLVE